MTKRLARLAVAAAAVSALALPAAPAAAEHICLVEESTIGLFICV